MAGGAKAAALMGGGRDLRLYTRRRGPSILGAVVPPRAVRLIDLEPRERRHVVVRTAATVTGAWVALLGAYYVFPVAERGGAVALARLSLGIVAFCAVVVWQTGSVMRARLPGPRAAQALGVVAPMFFVLCAAVYLAIDHASPGAFSVPLDHTKALYFVITVLSTVGFGDIVPRTDPARIVVSVQMLSDLVLIGFVARLIIGTAQARLADIRNGDRRSPPSEGATAPPRSPTDHADAAGSGAPRPTIDAP